MKVMEDDQTDDEQMVSFHSLHINRVEVAVRSSGARVPVNGGGARVPVSGGARVGGSSRHK